jgi:hypothetical protein
MVPGAPAASLSVAHNLPEIPTAPGGALQSIVTRVNQIPLDQIGQNVLDLTKQIDHLASSPKLKESVAQLDASLKEILSNRAGGRPEGGPTRADSPQYRATTRSRLRRGK